MKVKFLKDCEIEIIESWNEELDEANSTIEVFKVGEELEFDVVNHPERVINGELVEIKDMLNVQFYDGSVAYGLSKDWMEIIEQDEDEDECSVDSDGCLVNNDGDAETDMG